MLIVSSTQYMRGHAWTSFIQHIVTRQGNFLFVLVGTRKRQKRAISYWCQVFVTFCSIRTLWGVDLVVSLGFEIRMHFVINVTRSYLQWNNGCDFILLTVYCKVSGDIFGNKTKLKRERNGIDNSVYFVLYFIIVP